MASSNTPAADLVAAAITRSERTVTWVSDRSGIPRTTLKRRLRGHSDFTLSEVLAIAGVLDLHPGDLMPEQFHRRAA